MSTHNEMTAANTPGGDLPVSLRPGGPIDQALERARQSYQSVEGAEKLAGRACADMKRLREVYAQAVSDSMHGVPAGAEHALDAALADKHFTAEPVLRYSVAVAANSKDAARRLFPQAWTAYLSNPGAYDAVLGDAIPVDFLSRCDRHLARQAYFDGTNPTALDDFDTYIELTENSPAGGTGLPTGLKTLDRITGGTEGLTFVAGASGLGKTSLALTMAVSALDERRELGVVYFTFDMPKAKIMHRLLCRTAGLDDRTVKAGEFTDEQAGRLTRAKDELRRSVLPRMRLAEWGFAQRFDFSGGTRERRRMTLEFFTESITAFAQTARVGEVMVVIDSLGKLDVTEPGTPELAVDHRRLDLLLDLRDWSRSPANRNRHSIDGYPFVVVAELTKAGAKNDDLDLEDMLGSTKLGYAPDTVIGVQADRGRTQGPGECPIILKALKARSGEAGESVPATFHYHQFRITEPAATPKGDAPVRKRVMGRN